MANRPVECRGWVPSCFVDDLEDGSLFHVASIGRYIRTRAVAEGWGRKAAYQLVIDTINQTDQCIGRMMAASA
jgi:hypothetical protein